MSRWMRRLRLEATLLPERFGDVFPECGTLTSMRCGAGGTQDLATKDAGVVDTSGMQGTVTGLGTWTAGSCAEPDLSLRSALGEDFHSIPLHRLSQ